MSLRVSLVAALVALPFAVLVAWALSRSRMPGKPVLNLLVFLPLVMPPVVTGYGLLILFGKQGAIGGTLDEVFGITLAFRWTGAALAAAVMGFPLMVRAIRQGFDAVDTRLEDAASTLGASPRAVFLTITLPLIAPGVIAGAILGFAKALGEFGATITFVASIPGQTETLPSAIYTLLQVPGEEPAALRLIACSVVLAIGALIASEWLTRRAAERVRGG
ncbi:MAG: molybdate ABC transporter permease subunit [Pseudomonadota bacterium]